MSTKNKTHGEPKMKGQFDKYVNLIRKSAHFYARRWNIDYKEVESQGFLIYCQCLENYDVSQSKFSTHLSWELKRLNDYCRTYYRQQGELIDDYFNVNDPKLNPIDILPARYENVTLSDILQYSVNYLSAEAYKLLYWILGRTWEQKGRLKPSITLAMSTFNYTKEQATILWNEVGNFYRNNLYAL
jgi:hypothetical protein